jgi:hypothetical protein
LLSSPRIVLSSIPGAESCVANCHPYVAVRPGAAYHRVWPQLCRAPGKLPARWFHNVRATELCAPRIGARGSGTDAGMHFHACSHAYRLLTIRCSKAPVTMTASIAGQSLEGISNPTIIPVANVTIGPRSAARQRAANPLASQGGTGSRGAARSYSEKRLFMFHAPLEESFLLFTTIAVVTASIV